jgi:carboxyl-terminal processing protease
LLPLIAGIALAAGPLQDKYFEITKNIEIYTNVYKELNTHYVDELDPGKLMRTGIDAMANSLDPYTNYISESQVEDYRIFSEARYNGLGVEIRLLDDQVVLEEVFEGFPAQKAGLRSGDRLLSVNGRELKADDEGVAYRMMRGTPGSSVTIEYMRPGSEQVQVVEMKREEVDIPNVPYYKSLGEGVAYVKLSNFTANATKNIANAYKELKKENGDSLSGLVLDLRGNPGGLLMEAVSLVNLFVPQGELIVSTRGKVAEQDRLYRTMAPPMDLEIPVVVLIDQSSASASEIVSGALQDLDRGVVMGQLSYGKGLVQNTQEVGYNSRLKVTISKYYIPSGRCIQAVRYENGEPVALPDSLRQAFRTKNGRKVLDGGGVLPDLELEKDPPHPLVEQLKKEGWILRYVDNYCENIDSLDGGQEFIYTRYDDFLQFLKKSKFRYSGPADRQIDLLKKAVEEEGFTKELRSAMKNLEDGLQAEQEKLYSDLRPVISRAINREIIERYYYNTGIIAFELGSDSEVQEAKSLLLDPKEYSSVLKVSRK